MIDMDTIRAVARLNELTKLAENGILPFGKATRENINDHIFYDDSEPWCEFDNGITAYRVVLDSCVNELHHDIVSYDANKLWMTVVMVDTEPECDDVEPTVAMWPCDQDGSIEIIDGSWYVG